MQSGFSILSGIKERFNRFLQDLEEPPTGPRFRFVAWVLVPLLVLIALTAFGRFTGFDLGTAKAIYLAGGNSWAFGEIGFWQFFYHYGTLPATVVIVLAAVGYALSWSMERFRRWRRVFLFVVLSFALSSGVITNLVLKEYWGRPRPRQLLVTGGHQQFEDVLTFDPLSKGKSFPCGHATAGFFFVGGFFLLRHRRRDLALGVLIFGLIFGGLIGLARMVQGGHFFTDVVWSCAICWFSAMGVFYALKLDRHLTGHVSKKPMPIWLKIVSALVAIGLVVGILLGAPYREKRDLFIVDDFAKSGPLTVHLTFAVGEIQIRPGEKLHITGKAWGHGVPTSDIGEYFVVEKRVKDSLVVYYEEVNGRFTELEAEVIADIPWPRLKMLTVSPGDADVHLTVPEFEGTKVLQIGKGSSNLQLVLSGQKIELKEAKSGRLKFLQGEKEHQGNESKGLLLLEIADEFEGIVEIRK